jgi:hypothetical protein
MQERGRQEDQMMGACPSWNCQLCVMTNLVLLGSKVMSLYRSHTTCQQTVRFVPNHCGTCSGHLLLWNADVSLLECCSGSTDAYCLKGDSEVVYSDLLSETCVLCLRIFHLLAMLLGFVCDKHAS